VSGPKSKIIIFLLSGLAALAVPAGVHAQVGAVSGGSGFTPGPFGSIGTTNDPNRFGTVMVYLRTGDGQPVPSKVRPIVRIRSSAGGAALDHIPMETGEGYLFSQIGIDASYDILVRADGYLPAVQPVKLPNTPAATASVIVFLQPLDEELAFHPPTGQFVLAPKAAKELQNALHDLQYGRIKSGEKHAQKAVQISPDNPYAQYVMGLTYLLTNRNKEAKPYLEKSVSLDSREAPALMALGTVRYRLGDSAGAALMLTKALQLDPTSWKGEWLLGASYLDQKKYQEALDHANQALKVGKHQADEAKLVLAQAQAGLGQREAAAKTFESYAEEFPKDPNMAKIREWIALLKNPPQVVSKTTILLPSAPAVEVPPRPDWAPPDVDAVKPFAVSGATCPLPQILEAAGKNAEQLVSSLQQFTATEDFQEIEIKHGGQLDRPSDHSFKYLVLVDRVSPSAFDVREFRSHDNAQVQLPGRVQDTGVPALALAFHPIIQPDLAWTCEGLGTWDNQSAWVIRFEQKPKKPNVLAWFAGPSESYSLPLKGRAWVSASSDQVLHLETDLVSEIRPIDLKREHFSIDYQPVAFTQHDVKLWLPVNVDSYIQYQGHFLHYYHRFSDFKLFWVGTTQKISAPKEADKNQPDKKEQQ
jgi:tetratricopeptide (TPR) repeat protein